MTGWPRTLPWSNFQVISNPGQGLLVALNGNPIVARIAISIMFYPGTSPTVAVGAQRRFTSVDVSVHLDSTQMQYVPSRIPRRQETGYVANDVGRIP